MAESVIIVDENYKYVLSAAVSTCLLAFITPFVVSLKVRLEVFPQEFME